MKATHWTTSDDPEAWMDNPQQTPELAVEQWLADSEDDAAGDLMYELKRGPQTVEVYGYIETDAPLDEEDQFDGYEAGQMYFAPTCETVRVEVSLAYRVVPVLAKAPGVES